MSKSITAGFTPTDGLTGVRAKASDEMENLPSSSLHEQARQFSALLSEKDQSASFPQDLLSSKGLPFSREELMFARSLVDAKARHNGLPGDAIDPVDSPPRHEVNVAASFLVPSWPLPRIPVAPTPAAAAPDLTLAELVHRHVRRTLAVQATDGSGGDEVRLELSDTVLPGTTLALRRTGNGWQLVATTGNRQSLDKLGRFTPALIARFAQASLGSLEVVTHDPHA